MKTREQDDLEQLLRPLSEDDACGASLLYDADYERVRLSRQAPVSDLPAGVWERQAPRKVEWLSVYQECRGLLERRAKDLQVAAWLVEALVHRESLGGFARGWSFFSAMTMTFWNEVHPRIDDGDASMRLRPLTWLLRESVRWYHLGLFEPEAAELAGSAGLDGAHWSRVDADLTRLENFLDADAAVRDQIPSFGDLRVLVHARALRGTRVMASADAEIKETVVPLVVASTSMSRDEAYDRLHEIATVLARIEPHSPVPGVLRGLVRWRDARFEDLLERLPQGGPSVYELVKLFKADAAD